MAVLFTNLAVRAGIHFSEQRGKYNAWVIAISRFEAEQDGILQTPILITGWYISQYGSCQYDGLLIANINWDGCSLVKNVRR